MWPIPTKTLPALAPSKKVVAPRSTLCALGPMGLGTDQSEALSSYITRLALAHCVSPRRLIREELRRRAGQSEEMKWLGHTSQQMSMDGLGKFSQFLVPLLESLTTVSHLHCLTLLPLAGVLPVNGPHQLMRYPRWCPECFLEQIHSGQAIYRPLLWSLSLYRVCHRHNTPMLEICPACGSRQRFVPVYPDLIHCRQCGVPLINPALEQPIVDEVDLWKSHYLADLFSHQQIYEDPIAKEQLEAFLARVNQVELDGKPFPFGHQVRFILALALRSVAKGSCLSLCKILEIGHYTNTPPSAMLLRGMDIPLDPSGFKRQRIVPRKARTPFAVTEREELRRVLSHILADQNDIRSVAAIAKCLGCELSRLKYWYPEECRVLAKKAAQGLRDRRRAKHLEDQKRLVRIVKAAQSSSEPPTHRQIVSLLNAEGLYLVRPDLALAFRRYMEEGIEPTIGD